MSAILKYMSHPGWISGALGYIGTYVLGIVRGLFGHVFKYAFERVYLFRAFDYTPSSQTRYSGRVRTATVKITSHRNALISSRSGETFPCAKKIASLVNCSTNSMKIKEVSQQFAVKRIVQLADKSAVPTVNELDLRHPQIPNSVYLSKPIPGAVLLEAVCSLRKLGGSCAENSR